MQKDAVKTKLEYEYERFYMQCICLSKAGIFAKSSEIEWKKKIMKSLKEKLDGPGTFPEEILVLDNILDDAYRYAADHQSEKDSPDELIGRWMESVERGRMVSPL